MGFSLKPEQVKKAKELDPNFDGSWRPHDTALTGMTETAWKNAKQFAGVKSAKWFEKSNNIGPKLKTMQSARAKFTGQINLNNYSSLTKTLDELSKALGAFDKNRAGSDAGKDQQIKALVAGHKSDVDAALAWLKEPNQLLVVAYRDGVEGKAIVDTL